MHTTKETNKAKGDKVKQLRADLGQQEFDSFYTGRSKNYIRKCRAIYNDPRMLKRRSDQVDQGMAMKILMPRV